MNDFIGISFVRDKGPSIAAVNRALLFAAVPRSDQSFEINRSMCDYDLA